MPTFLSDPTQGTYLFLIACAVIAAAVAARRQDKRSAVAFAVSLTLLLAVYLIDRSTESLREEAVRRATAMGEAANARNPDAFVEHLADTFEYTGAAQPSKKTKGDVKANLFWNRLREHNVRVTTWDYSRAAAKEIDPSTVEIGFMAKGEVDGKPIPFYIRATFKKQSDGAMKLTALRSFHPTNHNEPATIPSF
jgi:hypothetical protein